MSKSMSFTFLGQIKSGKNNMKITREGRHYPNKEFAKWRSSVISQISQAYNFSFKPKDVFDKPCRITVKYWRGDNRRRDIPGMADALWHCLERATVVLDDKLFEEVHWLPQELDIKNPRTEIVIEEL